MTLALNAIYKRAPKKVAYEQNCYTTLWGQSNKIKVWNKMLIGAFIDFK